MISCHGLKQDFINLALVVHTHTSKLDCTEFFCLGGVFAECEEGGISAKEVRMVLASTATLPELWRQQGHQ